MAHGGRLDLMTLQTMSFIFGALLLAVGILGGGFGVKEIKVSNVTTSVRIVAGLIGIVFVGLGFLQPGPPTRPAPVAAPRPTPLTMKARGHHTDRVLRHS